MASPAGDRSWRRWTLRLGVAFVLALAAAAWPYGLFSGPAADQVEHMSAELERTRHAISAQRSRIAELRLEIEALKNQPGAIEDIARGELGMIMPGELVLRFEPGEPPPSLAAQSAPAPRPPEAQRELAVQSAPAAQPVPAPRPPEPQRGLGARSAPAPLPSAAQRPPASQPAPTQAGDPGGAR